MTGDSAAPGHLPPSVPTAPRPRAWPHVGRNATELLIAHVVARVDDVESTARPIHTVISTLPASSLRPRSGDAAAKASARQKNATARRSTGGGLADPGVAPISRERRLGQCMTLYAMKPRFGIAKRPMFGSTVGRLLALTPNQVASVALYSSTLVVEIQRPRPVSSSELTTKLGIRP